MNARALLPRRRHPAVAVTPKELLALGGRIALWLAVALVLVRGLAAIFGTQPHSERAAAGVAGRAWPDDAARAFAVEFATVYLQHADGHDPAAAAEAMSRFASSELAGALAPRLAGKGPRQTVSSVAVARVERVGRSRALITVAASVSADASRAVRLTIPVGRDADGGLVVYDLPSLAPAPRRGTVDAVDGDPLMGPESSAIFDVLERFFRAYLAGDPGALAYFVPAGTRPAAASGGFELVELVSIAATGPPSPRGRLVLATVEARDRATGAALALRYRVRMVQRDRWYVAALNDSQTGGDGR